MIQARITTLCKPAVGIGGRLSRAIRGETTGALGSRSPSVRNGRGYATKPLRGNGSPTTTAAAATTTRLVVARQHRSMVTITQTKSSDVPLFSSPEVDEDSSSSSSTTTGTAPMYVLNEESKLNVTQSCLNQVERLLRQRRERAEQQPENHGDDNGDDGYFLRVFVDAGGCSGFQYQFEVDNELDEDEDVVVAFANIDEDGTTSVRPRVVVDETSMGFLEGSTIDYVVEMIKSAFVVTDNPQSESACGCGSSFAVKNFEKFGATD